ncbi:hypothetical protein [Natrinema versiforme]|uniref:Uncharacterized protein n=1 Tax=Natrinema versiforme JCM 10478 TaxID=1227496 RepID=L9YBT8_9EURY|nr:hypothetical protein [Natrinema versiforme]ELY71091.1 hypothetical protein C489_02016 [Natrinema versiforme JCM 10478]
MSTYSLGVAVRLERSSTSAYPNKEEDVGRERSGLDAFGRSTPNLLENRTLDDGRVHQALDEFSRPAPNLLEKRTLDDGREKTGTFALERSSPIVDGTGVPVGGFRLTNIVLFDGEGEPLTRAESITARGSFPTSAPVTIDEQGRATAQLWLVSGETYDSFHVVSEPGDDGISYVWHGLEENAAIDGSESVVPLAFDVKEPEGKVSGGLSVGLGVQLG